jgi:hypothetical protein
MRAESLDEYQFSHGLPYNGNNIPRLKSHNGQILIRDGYFDVNSPFDHEQPM